MNFWVSKRYVTHKRQKIKVRAVKNLLGNFLEISYERTNLFLYIKIKILLFNWHSLNISSKNIFFGFVCVTSSRESAEEILTLHFQW